MGNKTGFCRSSHKCKLCYKSISAKWGNTSNLLSHLKNSHATEYREIKQSEDSSFELSTPRRRDKKLLEKGQQTLTEYIHLAKALDANSKEHRRFTRAVTNFIVKDVVLIYTVDKTGFRDMISAIEPRYQLPHKDYFSRVAIVALYEDTRHSLLSRLKNEATYFSGTVDLWSSCTSELYLSFTVHYIDTK